MGNIDTLIEHLAEIISDYRNGEIKPLGPEHVKKWVSQFDEHVRHDILSELLHALQKTYVRESAIRAYFSKKIVGKDLAGENASDFWWTGNFLNIQTEGESQIQMLKIFGQELTRNVGIDVENCGSEDGNYIYIDDASFSGNKVLHDLMKFLQNFTPNNINLDIITFALHTNGKKYADAELKKYALALSKRITIRWFSELIFENRCVETDYTDILSPSEIPDEMLVKDYMNSLSFKYYPRIPGSTGTLGIFSSERGRSILEREFLIAGARIRSMCPDTLNKYQRPLGNYVLKGPGFGSLLVTYRNCSNNCPLALWAGPPWYPLFPRKKN